MEIDHHYQVNRRMHFVEALLFTAGDVVTVEDLATRMSKGLGVPCTPEEAAEAVRSLQQHLAERGSALGVLSVAGGWRMVTNAEWASPLERSAAVERPRKLAQSLLETISVIAYQQPCTKAQVENVRGVDSDYAVKRLLELGFIDVAGRSDTVGKPLLYVTTPAFLDAFGMQSLDELPTLREAEELLADPRFQRERARTLLKPPDSPSSDAPSI